MPLDVVQSAFAASSSASGPLGAGQILHEPVPVDWGQASRPHLERAARAAGLPFDDLTMIFADVAETIYIDGCCHVNPVGSRLLAREIARIIRDRFAAGEPCPSFR